MGRTLLATTVRVLSVSPLEVFNHAKTVVEAKLVSLHLLASDVAQAAVEVSQSATKQVRVFSCLRFSVLKQFLSLWVGIRVNQYEKMTLPLVQKSSFW